MRPPLTLKQQGFKGDEAPFDVARVDPPRADLGHGVGHGAVDGVGQIRGIRREGVRQQAGFEQFRSDGLLITDFAVRQALGQKLSLSLRVSDPLDLARMHYRGEMTSQDFVQEGNRYWGQRQLSATLTWNFGQQGPRPPRRPQPQQQQPDPGTGFGF